VVVLFLDELADHRRERDERWRRRMSDEPRLEIRLPPITEETSVENIVAVLAVRDALTGEEVIWPPRTGSAVRM
jgi:hypothetical protein